MKDLAYYKAIMFREMGEKRRGDATGAPRPCRRSFEVMLDIDDYGLCFQESLQRDDIIAAIIAMVAT